MKKILLLEDEFDVIEKFTKIINKNNAYYFTSGGENIPISLVLDTGSLGRYDLEKFSAIFVDRDNFLDEKHDNFHEPFLEGFMYNYGHIGDLGEISKYIYPMSGSQKNNEYLKNQIIKVLENSKINSHYKYNYPEEQNYYIESREQREYFENILNNNILTKSYPGFLGKIETILLNN